MPLPDPMPVAPLEGPLDVVVSLPGSKSITNRALVCAALADGTSTLTNALHADDTEAMVEGLRAMGAEIDARLGRRPAGRHGHGRPADQRRGASSTPGCRAPRAGSCSRSPGWARGTGASMPPTGCASARWREVLDAVRALGAEVHDVGAPGHLPVEVVGGTLAGGEVAVRGDVSSQFLSGLLLGGPAMRTGLVARLVGDLVSEPYVDMTVAVMADLRRGGASGPDDRTWVVEPQTYRAADLAIEPDASAASYVFAAAALVGGRATVDRPRRGARCRATSRFVDVLEQMGATVERGADEHDGHRHRARCAASRST